MIGDRRHLTPGQLQAVGDVRRADGGPEPALSGRRISVDQRADNRHWTARASLAKVGANATWHTDHTNQELPPKFTMLYAVAVPDRGGGTSVCNARAPTKRFPDDLKLKIADAKTENTLISSARMKTGNPDIVKAQLATTKPPTVHPLVRTHPETGTKAVWFHKAKTETVTGMSPEETQDFLQDLTDRITQPAILLYARIQEGRSADHRRPRLVAVRPASITITASIGASIGCWCVGTVPTEKPCEQRRSHDDAQLAGEAPLGGVGRGGDRRDLGQGRRGGGGRHQAAAARAPWCCSSPPSS